MRLIDTAKFLLVLASCIALDFASVRMSMPDLSLVALPVCVLGHYFAAASLPGMKARRPLKQHGYAVLLSLMLSVLTFAALLIYGIELRGGQLTD